MSDEPPATAAPAGPAKAKSSKAMLGLLVLNLVGTGFVVYRLMTVQPAAAAPGKNEHAPAAAPSSEITGPVVALDPFVVNLDEPGTSRYLKMTLELELMPNSEAVLVKHKQLVRDTILNHVSGLHVKDTLGAGAKDKIRSELMAKLTKLLGPQRVRRIFFVDFVVQ